MTSAIFSLPTERQKIAAEWENHSLYDEHTVKEVNQLKHDNPQEYYDAFYKDLSFGTGGMRSIMGVGPNRLNQYTIAKATQGLANFLKSHYTDEKIIRVAVAHDCRINSKAFTQITAQVLSANGIECHYFDELRPTPLLSYAVRYLDCKAGIVITASHNPKEYNGYKVYSADGSQITPPLDHLIVDSINQTQMQEVKYQGNPALVKVIAHEVEQSFIKQSIALSHLTKDNISKKKTLTIAFSPIHGTSATLMEPALSQLGYEYWIPSKQLVPDGHFTHTKSANPEEPEAFEEVLKLAHKQDSDLVITTDPDADRLGVVFRKAKGEYAFLNGNQLALILTDFLLKNYPADLDQTFISRTIVTTELLDRIAEHYGTSVVTTLTGFKWIGKRIFEYEGDKKHIGGGEESYGYLVSDFVRDKDSITTALLTAQIAQELKDEGKTLGDYLFDIYAAYGFMYETLFSITKKGEQGVKEIEAIIHKFRTQADTLTIMGQKVAFSEDYAESKRYDLQTGDTTKIDMETSNVICLGLENNTRIYIRPSGTEPKIKFYMAAEFEKDLHTDVYTQIDKAKTYLNNLAEELKSMV